MLNGVHGHTSHHRLAVALGLVLVVGTTGLQDGLVDTSTSSHDTNHGTVVGGDYLLGSGRKLDAGLLRLGVAADDCGVVARSAGQGAAVAVLLLHVAHNGTFRHGTNRDDVADLEGGFLSEVDELPGTFPQQRGSSPSSS